MTSILILLLIMFTLCCIAFGLLLRKALKIRKELKSLQALRQNDIIETNRLFVEKSENELRLFFQFENVLEEIVKQIRKNDNQNTKILEGVKEIKVVLEYHLNNQK